MKIYISHSVGCAGWDLPAIYEGTTFQNACRTMRFKVADKGLVKMLDWDYKEWKKDPEKVEKRHLELCQEENFEVVMSMDLWKDNVQEALDFADMLQDYTDRVLVPAHYYPPELINYQVAYPNANWFAKNVFPPVDYHDNITHLLGGSPQSQLRLAALFPNIQSVDGNQIFNVAIRHGKYWTWKRGKGDCWIKPRREMSNDEIFKRSVQNVDHTWRQGIKPQLTMLDFYTPGGAEY